MTREEREEAIEYLNTLYMALAVFPNQQISLGNVDEMKESVSMAIEALEQEPSKREIEREYLFQSLCEDFKKLQAENDDLRKRLEQEPCEDAISRQYLVEKAVSWDKHFADSIRYVALTDILNAPSVMREATQEEREGVGQYIDSIAEPCDVLDKIRAEIEQNAYPIVHGVNNHEKGMTLYGILQVIDKYKAEKEYKAKVITRGNCMMCGKELTEGLFFCKECENKANDRK